MLDRGILGMNARNSKYISTFNAKKGIRLANNKQSTKKFLTQRGIPVPQTLVHITKREQLMNYDFSTISQSSFVIKPNNGSKGKGIFIVSNIRKATRERTSRDISLIQQGREYLKKYLQGSYIDHGYEFLIEKKRRSEEKLKYTLLGIFDGHYNSQNKNDTVLIEEKLVPGEGFKDFCHHGLADMRVILFNLVPIIAMLRMPTASSGGKANLAQGGIGLGLDIITGKITTLYYEGQAYDTAFPEPRTHLQNKKIPFRQDILYHSSNAQYFSNVGYLGLDRVITPKGPRLLEINARAGLEIQNITKQPLLTIMKKIDDLHITTPEKGIQIAKSLFSTENINELKKHHVLYLSQHGLLSYHKNQKKRALPVTITVNLDKKKNYTSAKIMKKISDAHHIDIQTDTETVIKNIVLKESIDIKSNTIQLGQESVSPFYIKATHKAKVSTKYIQPGYILDDEKDGLKVLDDHLHDINKQINLAQLLWPSNYLNELDMFISYRGHYNPQFTYDLPRYKELQTASDMLARLRDDYHTYESKFTEIFMRKIDEIENKIALIKAYKKQDIAKINTYNYHLFGGLDETLIYQSEQRIMSGIDFSPRQLGQILHTDRIVETIREHILHTGLPHTRVRVDQSNLSRLSVGLGRYATIKVASNAIMREYKLLSKLIHEIDVHATRYYHGKMTGRHILSTGTGYYLEDEEGLAMYLAQQFLQMHIPGYDGIAKYKNYLAVGQSRHLDRSGLGDYILSQKKYIRDSMSGIKSRDHNYRVLFNTILKFKKGLRDTSITDAGLTFAKNKVYLSGYQKYHTLVQNDSEKAKDSIKKMIKYGKIGLNDLSYFVS